MLVRKLHQEAESLTKFGYFWPEVAKGSSSHAASRGASEKLRDASLVLTFLFCPQWNPIRYPPGITRRRVTFSPPFIERSFKARFRVRCAESSESGTIEETNTGASLLNTAVRKHTAWLLCSAGILELPAGMERRRG
jgi:hypothetical protein